MASSTARLVREVIYRPTKDVDVFEYQAIADIGWVMPDVAACAD